MRIKIPNARNSIKCPRCGKLISPEWFGYRCTKCSYEQLNKEGREFVKEMSKVETL